MTKMRKPKVFLSYAREDQATALRLHDDLEANGVAVWIDEKDLLPGQDWRYRITAEIRESDFVIVLLSRTSVAKRGYVQKELRLALEVLDEMPPATTFLLPVRLHECKPAHPVLESFTWVDLFPSYEGGLNRILRALTPTDATPMSTSSCPHCDAPLRAADPVCRTCGTSVQPPNVRAAAQERDALDVRYRSAVDRSRIYGYEEKLHAFEDSVKSSAVVLQMGLKTLFALLSDSDERTFANRPEVVDDKWYTRHVADYTRLLADHIMFPSYANTLRYGLVSADGHGLTHFGPAAVALQNKYVAHRATITESDSVLITNHLLLSDRVPAGLRSIFEDRHKLAVAKLGHLLAPEVAHIGFPKLLLTSGHADEKADFMEAQVYGPIHWRAIQGIRISTPPNASRDHYRMRRALADLAQKMGISCELFGRRPAIRLGRPLNPFDR